MWKKIHFYCRKMSIRENAKPLSAMVLVVLEILTLRYGFDMKERSEIHEICKHYREHVGVPISLERILLNF